MIAKLTLSAAGLAASLIAAPAFAQQPKPVVPAPPVGTPQPPVGIGPLAAPPPVAMNLAANAQVDGIRMQWDQARNALLQARNRANVARQAVAQAEMAEAQAQQAFDRVNTGLLNVLFAATARQPVPQPLAYLPPELPPPNVQVVPPQGVAPSPQGQLPPGVPPRP